MLKLFILTFFLFSAIPTFAMRTIKSRLMQRGYATMTKENLTTLMKHKDSPVQFAYELDTMKKDNEDLVNLWTIFHLNVKDLEKELKSHDPNSVARDINFFGFFTMTGGLTYLAVDACYPYSLPTLELWMNNTVSGSLLTAFGYACFSGGILFLLSKNKLLTARLKRFNDMSDELEKNKKNLTKVESLLFKNKE